MKVIAVLLLLICPAQPLLAQAPPLSLDTAIRLFLERNVEVAAARAQIGRASAEQIAAKLRPNPVITVTAENLKLSGPASSSLGIYRELTTTYAETIELGGKRQLRGSVADAAVTVAEMNFENSLRELLSELKQSYFEAVLARHNLDIAAENRDTFEQLVRFNVVRFEEGAIAEGDLMKVRLERMKFDAAVRRAEMHLSQAMVQLLEKLEEPDFSARPLAGSLEVPLVSLDLRELIQAAIQNRPDLKSADAEIELGRRRVTLENARARMDISPFIGFKRVASNNELVAGVSIPLKLRDRNEGGIARAAADEKIAQAHREVVENRVRVDVETAYRAYESARDQVVMFRDQLLRQADESRAVTLAAYEEGASDLTPVLEAQRTRSEIRQEYFGTLFNYQASILQLELAVGREIQP